jgi:hypothetical protein
MGNILFTTQGRTALVDSDSTQVRYLAFDVPDQETWQPAGTFADGRLLMVSREARRDGPGKSFYEYFHHTPTHIWIYDIDEDVLSEVVLQPRLAPGQTPALLLGDQRLLIQVERDEGAQVYNVALDGTDARPITEIGEGLPYGFNLSPDGGRLAFHLAGPQGYQIWTSDPFGAERVLVAANNDWLVFGPQWSPDGQWLAYQGCLHEDDPGHDWSDLWIARPDGSEQRRLTDGQALWFGASYGPAERHGGESNVPVWTPDGAILASCRTPARTFRGPTSRSDLMSITSTATSYQRRPGVARTRFAWRQTVPPSRRRRRGKACGIFARARRPTGRNCCSVGRRRGTHRRSGWRIWTVGMPVR